MAKLRLHVLEVMQVDVVAVVWVESDASWCTEAVWSEKIAAKAMISETRFRTKKDTFAERQTVYSCTVHRCGGFYGAEGAIGRSNDDCSC